MDSSQNDVFRKFKNTSNLFSTGVGLQYRRGGEGENGPPEGKFTKLGG